MTPITSPEQLPLVMDSGDVAAFLRKSKRTIERFRKKGLMPKEIIPGCRPPIWHRDVILDWSRKL
jgi:hypothetical protein